MNSNIERKRKKRLNLADFVIIITTVFLLLLIANLFLGNTVFDFGKKTDILYTVKLENVDQSVLNLIQANQIAINYSSDTEIGLIDSVDISNSLQYEYSGDLGYYKAYTYPDLYDINITLKSNCKVDKNRYYIDDFEVVSGKKIQFKTNNTLCQGVITKVEKLHSNTVKIVNDTNEEQWGDWIWKTKYVSLT